MYHRDRDRIPRILAKLQIVWEHYPDWRLGQLLENASEPKRTPPFYIEDDVTEKGLDRLIEKLGK